MKLKYLIQFGQDGIKTGIFEKEIESTPQGAKNIASKLYRSVHGIGNKNYPRIHLYVYNPQTKQYKITAMKLCINDKYASWNKWMTPEEMLEKTGGIALCQ